MGFTPAQIDEMSVWEFAACVKGWNKANSDEGPDPPSAEEYEAMMERAAKREALH